MQVNAATKLMTAEEFADLPESSGVYELIRGELREVNMTKPGGNHGFLAEDIGFEISSFARQHHLGRVTAAETGFLLSRNPDTVRAPDVAFITADRLAEARTARAIPIAPDLVVEVNSPNDRAAAVIKKVEWWLGHGVRLVWVADPSTQTITRYLPGGEARVFHNHETIDGGDVLPGFKINLTELFEQPAEDGGANP